MSISYCKSCEYLVEKVHESGFGDWPCTCEKLGIGRNPDTWSCDKIVPKEAEKE